jgi:hypothetical protein
MQLIFNELQIALQQQICIYNLREWTEDAHLFFSVDEEST